MKQERGIVYGLSVWSNRLGLLDFHMLDPNNSNGVVVYYRLPAEMAATAISFLGSVAVVHLEWMSDENNWLVRGISAD